MPDRDQYADCDSCGERYWGRDADNYLRETPTGRALCARCREPRRKAGQPNERRGR